MRSTQDTRGNWRRGESASAGHNTPSIEAIMEGINDAPAVSVVVGGGGAMQGELEHLKARVAALEEENDLLAVAATREPELLADVQRCGGVIDARACYHVSGAAVVATAQH